MGRMQAVEARIWPPIPRDYNAAVDFVDRNVAEGRADKLAFHDGAESLTYGELAARVNRFANALRALSLRPEQRIAMVMLDTVDFPVVFWGAIKAGIVPIPLNTLLGEGHYRHILADSRAAALVVSPALWTKLGRVVAELARPEIVILAGGSAPSDTLSLDALLAGASSEAAPADTSADEVAFWLYSSGSTGAPKGVRHVHSSLMQTARLYGRDVLGIREDDVVFSAAKLFFAYGLGNAMSFPMSVGASAVLLADRPAPDAVLAVLREHQPTVFYGVPTLYGALLAHPELSQGAGSTRLRACISAGEALPRDIGEKWRARVGVDILDGIGSTEMLHIFLSNRPDALRYGSSGLPVPGYEARIVDEQGVAVPDGEIGELIIRGPSAADGYWNQRDKSRRTFAGEWTYTGDKYRQDADGYYVYCGRTDDMFKVSGLWVSPFDVESALLSHPSVLEAAVIGRVDADGLVKPKAFIVLKPGARPSDALLEEIKAHVKAKSGPWAYPRWIELRDELPKTATGKIQRFRLRAEG